MLDVALLRLRQKAGGRLAAHRNVLSLATNKAPGRALALAYMWNTPAGALYLRNTSVQYGLLPLQRIMPMPTRVQDGLSMFWRWPELFIQPV